jgi:hypothetical protein
VPSDPEFNNCLGQDTENIRRLWRRTGTKEGEERCVGREDLEEGSENKKVAEEGRKREGGVYLRYLPRTCTASGMKRLERDTQWCNG